MVQETSGDAANDLNISAEEAAVYDRQIRLWGMDAQNRIRNANVFLGGMNGLGAEVAKNLVLAGINNILLQDDQPLTSEDRFSQFLASVDDVGKNRAEASRERCQELNPMVNVEIETRSIDELPVGYFDPFQLICLLGKDMAENTKLDELCRKSNKKFYCGDVFGTCGYFFMDLKSHDYVQTVSTSNDVDEGFDVEQSAASSEPEPKRSKVIDVDQPASSVVKKSMNFVSLNTAWTTDWDKLGKERKLRRFPKSFFKILVIQAFRTKHKRNPTESEVDLAELESLRDEHFKINRITATLEPDWSKNCIGMMNSTCAIVGGVLAAEIIKLASKREYPVIKPLRFRKIIIIRYRSKFWFLFKRLHRSG